MQVSLSYYCKMYIQQEYFALLISLACISFEWIQMNVDRWQQKRIPKYDGKLLKFFQTV